MELTRLTKRTGAGKSTPPPTPTGLTGGAWCPSTQAHEIETAMRKNAGPLVQAAVVLMLGTGLAGCVPSEPATPTPVATKSPQAGDLSVPLRRLETEFDATVGMSAIDTASGRELAYNADVRFRYTSTLKVLAAAEMLHDVPPAGRKRIVTWSQADVKAAGYSPVTAKHVRTGLSLAQLAEAAVRSSDNTAMNLVLARIGGPAGLDAGLAELGDSASDVVDGEPELNVVKPGGTHNTSTPAAFTHDLVALFSGTYLPARDKDLLLDWMSGNATGDSLIRAGAPDAWVVADKSGGAGGTRNDVAVVTPAGRKPIVITVFTTRNDPGATYDDALVAAAARVILENLE